MYKVVISAHAKQRLMERAGLCSEKALNAARSEILRRLIASLRLGTVPDEELGVTVYLTDGYRAICYPTYQGTWAVATVLPPEGTNEAMREGETA